MFNFFDCLRIDHRRRCPAIPFLLVKLRGGLQDMFFTAERNRSVFCDRCRIDPAQQNVFTTQSPPSVDSRFSLQASRKKTNPSDAVAEGRSKFHLPAEVKIEDRTVIAIDFVVPPLPHSWVGHKSWRQGRSRAQRLNHCSLASTTKDWKRLDFCPPESLTFQHLFRPWNWWYCFLQDENCKELELKSLTEINCVWNLLSEQTRPINDLDAIDPRVRKIFLYQDA